MYTPNEVKNALQEKDNLLRFISPKGMNIRALGEKTLEKLHGRRLVTTPQELYQLNTDYILNRKILTPHLLNKIQQAILKTPGIKLPNVLYALNIPNLGIDYSKVISLHCMTLRGFIDDIDYLAELEGLPEHVKDSVADWVNAPDNIALVEFLISRRVGLIEYGDENKGKPLQGQRWYFSVLDVRTLGLRKKIQQLGGTISDTITKKELYAVFVDPPRIHQQELCHDKGVTVLTLSQAQDKIEKRKQCEDKKITDRFVRHLRAT